LLVHLVQQAGLDPADKTITDNVQADVSCDAQHYQVGALFHLQHWQTCDHLKDKRHLLGTNA
jgi:hypothetical protein